MVNTNKGFVPSKQFQASNLGVPSFIGALDPQTGKYTHEPLSSILAGVGMGMETAKIETLTAGQITADSAVKSIPNRVGLVVKNVIVCANGKFGIDAATTSVVNGTNVDITVTGFADEITESQDLQLLIDWGHPNLPA